MTAIPELAAWIGGLVAGEGTFGCYGKHFRFAITMGQGDSEACELLNRFFRVGTIHKFESRREGYEGEVVFQVRKLRDLVEVIVPFMDEHLLPSYKQQQYLIWRESLLSYWDSAAKRRRSCSVEGCEAIRRAHGLCRRHLFAQGLG